MCIRQLNINSAYNKFYQTKYFQCLSPLHLFISIFPTCMGNDTAPYFHGNTSLPSLGIHPIADLRWRLDTYPRHFHLFSREMLRNPWPPLYRGTPMLDTSAKFAEVELFLFPREAGILEMEGIPSRWKGLSSVCEWCDEFCREIRIPQWCRH